LDWTGGSDGRLVVVTVPDYGSEARTGAELSPHFYHTAHGSTVTMYAMQGLGQSRRGVNNGITKNLSKMSRLKTMLECLPACLPACPEID